MLGVVWCHLEQAASFRPTDIVLVRVDRPVTLRSFMPESPFRLPSVDQLVLGGVPVVVDEDLPAFTVEMVERSGRVARSFRLPPWCPRCDVPAEPTMWSYPQGWCPICGIDPSVEGPARPFAPQGILSWSTA